MLRLREFLPRCFVPLVLIQFLFPISAQSAEVNSVNYDIYVGDLNGDGYSDYYFAAKPFALLLHGDIVTPIIIPMPGVTSFSISRNGVGYGDPAAFALDISTLNQKISQGTLVLAVANTDYYNWNNGITGQSFVLLRGATSTAPSLLINTYASQALPLVAQTYQPNASANLSNKSLPITIADNNLDGKKDILIAGYVYLADASGVPSLTPYQTNQTGTISTTFTYDSLGRLQKVEATDGTVSNYQYDKQDNRTSSNNTKGVQ